MSVNTNTFIGNTSNTFNVTGIVTNNFSGEFRVTGSSLLSSLDFSGVGGTLVYVQSPNKVLISGAGAGGAPASAQYGAGVDNKNLFYDFHGPDSGYDYEFDDLIPAGSTLPSGWFWVNQGSADYRENLGCGRVDKNAGDSLPNLRGIVKNLPAATAYTIYAKTFHAQAGAIGYGGVILRNSGQGGMLLAEEYLPNSTTRTYYVGQFQSPTNDNGGGAFGAGLNIWPAGGQFTWWKIIKSSATSWITYVSNDGGCWFDVSAPFDPTSITNLTSGVNQVGFGLQTTVGGHVGMQWLRVRDITV